MSKELRNFKIREDHLLHVINTLKTRPYEEVHVAMVLLESLTPLEEEELCNELEGVEGRELLKG